ncbi:uncharacterized protein LOC103153083 [Poecilia formosa]|uniref:uncharacterized protein LOC103153083 n=1 Tax=Poecilia formosa TaxID=48698 RepID=UPI000443DB7A|nr:PREDICTED: uncharacterized protein LOC103153083 [Poecilia formosa]
MSRMSYFGCKNRELRVLVMGTDRKVTKSLIEDIEHYADETPQESSNRSADCWVNICTSKDQRVSVTMDGLHMDLFDIRSLCDSDDISKMTERGEKYISTSARHVFLLVMTQNPSEDGGKNQRQKVIDDEKKMVEEIKETFGDEALKYMVVVFKNVKSNDGMLKESLRNNAKELWALINPCPLVPYEINKDVPEEIKKVIKEINERPGGTCYTHKMLEAHSKKGGCKWENFSLPTKVCVLILCCVAIAVGYFLFCCGKELIETAASAATKGLMNVSE